MMNFFETIISLCILLLLSKTFPCLGVKRMRQNKILNENSHFGIDFGKINRAV